MNWKFYLMLVYPNLEVASKLLAARDADSVGTDDKVAAVLHFASISVQAILNDQPLPNVPAILLPPQS